MAVSGAALVAAIPEPLLAPTDPLGAWTEDAAVVPDLAVAQQQVLDESAGAEEEGRVAAKGVAEHQREAVISSGLDHGEGGEAIAAALCPRPSHREHSRGLAWRSVRVALHPVARGNVWLGSCGPAGRRMQLRLRLRLRLRQRLRLRCLLDLQHRLEKVGGLLRILVVTERAQECSTLDLRDALAVLNILPEVHGLREGDLAVLGKLLGPLQ
mmetsp:Transcript_70137/g.198808  ORF Transcript_70137/g.198808 Transcript_70137/m.198808 type:complete len:212 (+) Transcript_70137:476-1111(+)